MREENTLRGIRPRPHAAFGRDGLRDAVAYDGGLISACSFSSATVTNERRVGRLSGRSGSCGKSANSVGPSRPRNAGGILPHEHLFCDLRAYFTEPEETEKKAMAAEPVSLSNLFWVRRQYFANHDNLLLREVDTATRGGTILQTGRWRHHSRHE